MVFRIVGTVIDSLLSKVSPSFCYLPIAASPNAIQNSSWSLQQLLDGYLWATPKRRTQVRQRWRIKYGDDNWKDGTKLFKPKRNLVSCGECGNFHEAHAICRQCYEKVAEESKKIIESIRNIWDKKVIDQDVEVLYQGEKSSAITAKRIVEQDRPRPLWFVPNLIQKTAYPKQQINGPVAEIDNRTIQVKEE